jgi:uncharacterized protein involved in exopolysaccharide biosynthesis
MMSDNVAKAKIPEIDRSVVRDELEVDLKELADALWVAKIPIVVFTMLCALMSVCYAMSIPNQYKAEAVLAPAQQQSSGLSGALGQLGGLASLAGVSVGGSGANESKIAQKVMNSWSFIDQFIKDNQLEAAVFAVEGWDQSANRARYNSDLYNSTSQQWLIEGEDGSIRGPSSWDLFVTFSEKLTVVENKTTDLVTVSIEHYSPQQAKQWLDMFVDAINQHMQLRQMVKVTSNIAYLQAQIEKTSIAEMKEVFYTIIQEQIKSKMLAEASPEYVFVAVSPSMVPERKSQPKRAIICVLSTFFGGMIAVGITLLRHIIRRNVGHI